MPDKRSDADIVQAVLEGEIDAFEVLVQRYQKKVYNTVLRLAGHAAEAEDLSQEVFLKLYRGLSSFRGESSFSTYLYRIAANTAIDALRRASPQAISLSAEDEEGEPYELALSDGEPLPLELLEREERTAAIREAIDALPPHHRAVIVLREIEGMSYQEIARVLSVEEGTVKSRINRARAGLRELLFQGNYFKRYTTKEVKTEKEVQRA
ncbi:MAG: sigma-70 family RNA polymerase sigma factor [Clostridia bacterium]|nr:sigma-70 family RNA polymerase sigma factor [Clostridia bacterium]